MQFNKLNGWQRLWVLTSIIYLVFVIFKAIPEFPSGRAIPEITSSGAVTIAADDVIKNLSTKTMEICSKLYPNDKKPEDIDDHIYLLINHTPADSRFIPLRFISMKPSPFDKQAIEYIDANKVLRDFISIDYNNAVTKILNKKRMLFVGAIISVWIIPCLIVYVSGLSFRWVYRGFRKDKV